MTSTVKKIGLLLLVIGIGTLGFKLATFDRCKAAKQEFKNESNEYLRILEQMNDLLEKGLIDPSLTTQAEDASAKLNRKSYVMQKACENDGN